MTTLCSYTFYLMYVIILLLLFFHVEYSFDLHHHNYILIYYDNSCVYFLVLYLFCVETLVLFLFYVSTTQGFTLFWFTLSIVTTLELHYDFKSIVTILRFTLFCFILIMKTLMINSLVLCHINSLRFSNNHMLILKFHIYMYFYV